MSSNINPLGPPPGLMQYLKDNLDAITRLPEVDAAETVKRFGSFLGVDSQCLLAGNGTTQFIYALPRILETRKALIIGPTYADYGDACRLQGIPHSFHMADESNKFIPGMDQIEKKLAEVDTVFICNPNNPTGALIPSDALHTLCRSYPQKNFIIDESYLDFVTNGENQTMLNSGLDNVMVLLSISKIFKIPGLRIGFIATDENRIEKFKQYMLPWSVNSLAQQAVNYITDHKILIRSFISETRAYINDQRQRFFEAVCHIDRFRLFDSQAPFVLIRLNGGLTAQAVWQSLARDNILIRRCSNVKGLSDRFIRISLKTQEDNRLVASRLIALSQIPETETGPLHELQVAC
jgi:threonine-phosphate decarboxylase